MNRDIKYILKRVIIGVLIGIILFVVKGCNVKALTIDEVSWVLSPNQYIRSLSGGTDQYSYNSSNWGNYSVNNYRSVYEYGAYVSNPVCEEDYCLVEDKSYIMSFFINSSKNFSSNFASILSDNSNFHIRVSYLNTSNQKVWVTLNSNDFNYYVIQKISDKSYQFSLIFTMPKLPSNANTSHFMELDFWVLPTTSYPNNELLYTANANVTTGINNFTIENATPSNLIEYITRIKQVNQNQLIINEQQNTTDAINDLNNTMNDSSTDSPNSGINAVKNGIANNGVITQLITLPVTLFQQILSSINGTCQTFNLGSLFGTDLTLPCINVSNYLGATLWGIIDVIISGYFVWVIARKMISAFEMFSAMKDGDVLDD